MLPTAAAPMARLMVPGSVTTTSSMLKSGVGSSMGSRTLTTGCAVSSVGGTSPSQTPQRRRAQTPRRPSAVRRAPRRARTDLLLDLVVAVATQDVVQPQLGAADPAGGVVHQPPEGVLGLPE